MFRLVRQALRSIQNADYGGTITLISDKYPDASCYTSVPSTALQKYPNREARTLKEKSRTPKELRHCLHCFAIN